jgi:hypothetical protein
MTFGPHLDRYISAKWFWIPRWRGPSPKGQSPLRRLAPISSQLARSADSRAPGSAHTHSFAPHGLPCPIGYPYPRSYFAIPILSYRCPPVSRMLQRKGW